MLRIDTGGRASDGAHTVTLNGVTDTLRNVQSVRFADQTITILAPTVNAATLSPGLGDLTTGRVVLVTLDMSAPVTVAGVPAPPTSCSAIRLAAGSTTSS